MRKRSALVFLLLPLVPSVLLANKTSVELSGPEAVTPGTEVTIVVKVSHSGNNSGHFTDWVLVKAGGSEIARWDFTSDNRPESANFSREVKFKITHPVEITAQGHCNLHGGREPAVLRIGVQ